ncbi:MAG: hypothetical protein FWG68_09385, partial [Defluviitaleaceae bacterium]|nr:hypothetical protein [Defluviitaleaceae bacterium]
MSKNSKKSQYLGSMVLNNQKVIDISPMYDIFLQYAFKNNTGADILAKATNIFITELKFMEGTFAYMPKIEGEVSVDTQYAYIISKEKKGAPRTQDLKLTSQKRRAFIELQNRINKKTNVVKRAFDYFILGITWNNRE